MISKVQIIKEKVEIRSLLTNAELERLDSRKVFVVSVIDDQGKYAGFRLVSDLIPSDWSIQRINGQSSLFPIVQGG